MKTDRESDKAEAPTIALMIALLVCVVCLVANAVGDSPLEVAASEDQLEVPSSRPVASVADLRDTIDADISTSRADLATERPAPGPNPSVMH